MRKLGRAAVVLVCALVAALALGACGGSDSTDSTATTAAPANPASRSAQSGGDHGAAKQGGKGAGGSSDSEAPEAGGGSSHVNVTPLRVSPRSSSEFRVKGGDNSVQSYGAEADESELSEVAQRVHSFYVARVAGEWARACSYLAKATIEGFEKIAASTPKLAGKGCPGVLDALTEGVSPALQGQLTAVDAASLRSEGETGFLIYTGPPDETVYAMPLRLEDGEWKVAALQAAALPGAKAP